MHPKPVFFPVFHSERSEESKHAKALSVRTRGFFAALRMTEVERAVVERVKSPHKKAGSEEPA
jgi:hypothetical protein